MTEEQQGRLEPWSEDEGPGDRSRRRLIKGSAGLLALAAGGLLWRAYDTGVFSVAQGPAYAPWTSWQGQTGEEATLGLVRAGVLAASAHNSQPWLFRLGFESVELLADRSRNLGALDPFRREMHISLGCALENMVLAAPAQGYDPKITFLPGRLDGEDFPSVGAAPVAHLQLTPSRRELSGLYAAIPKRHTNRGPYLSDRAVPRDLIWAFNDLAREDEKVRLMLLDGGQKRENFDRLLVEATEAIVADEEMIAASSAWFRLTPDEIEAHRDGPTIDSFGLPPLSRAAVKMLPKPELKKTHQQWVEATRDIQLATAPLVGLIAVRDPYDQESALRTGILWQRLHLWATSQGLAMQPMNQIVEMVDRERQLQVEPTFGPRLAALLNDDAWQATLAFRVGYPSVEVPPSPRRGLAELVDQGPTPDSHDPVS